MMTVRIDHMCLFLFYSWQLFMTCIFVSCFGLLFKFHCYFPNSYTSMLDLKYSSIKHNFPFFQNGSIFKQLFNIKVFLFQIKFHILTHCSILTVRALFTSLFSVFIWSCRTNSVLLLSSARYLILPRVEILGVICCMSR